MKDKIIAFAKVAIFAVWVYVAIIAMQLAVGYLMIFILGRERLYEPIWEAVYTMLSYVAAFVILEFLTPVLENLGRKLWDWTKTKHKNKREGGAKGEKRDGKEALPQTHGRRNLERAVRWRAANREELGLTGLPTWVDIAFGCVGYIVSIFAASLAIGWFENFSWFNSGEEQDLLFSPYVEGTDRAIAFVILALVAPIAEELIFRGWLYGKTRKILKPKIGKWWAITLSTLVVSVLFGILHGQWNVGVTVFMLSVVACILRELTGTIYAGILVHIIKNGIAFYLLFMVGMGT